MGYYAFPGQPGPAPGLVYAGFWWRVLGYIVDSIIIGIPTGGIFLLFFWSTLSNWFTALANYINTVCVNGTCNSAIPAPKLTFPAGSFAVYAVFGTLVSLLYFGVLVSSWGSTVGQRVIGARVVRVEDPARRLPLERAALRAVIFWGPGLITGLLTLAGVAALGDLIELFVLLAVLWVAWDRRKQGLHDKMGRALVVRQAPAMALAPYGSPYPQAAPDPTAYPPNPYLPPPQVPPTS
jgi:uncharacterized RDD family membrane protein YckC